MLIQLIPNYIFICLRLFIPLFFVLRVFKINLPKLNQTSLIISFNITILIGCMLSLGVLIAGEVLYANFRQDMFERAIGPYWWAWWMMAFPLWMLPQLIWFQKIRTSITITYVWFVISFIMAWLPDVTRYLAIRERDYIPSSWTMFIPNWSVWDYLEMITIFLVVIVPVYLVANGKQLLK